MPHVKLRDKLPLNNENMKHDKPAKLFENLGGGNGAAVDPTFNRESAQ